MKLSDKQINELAIWEYFIPKNCQWADKTDNDIKMFFEWSEQGKHKDTLTINTYKPEGRTYFHALYWGKIWAGRHMEMYEEGVMSGDMPYVVILEDKPLHVKKFMVKEMFKGSDKDLILSLCE